MAMVEDEGGGGEKEEERRSINNGCVNRKERDGLERRKDMVAEDGKRKKTKE